MIIFFTIVFIVAVWFIYRAVSAKPQVWSEWKHHRDTTPLLIYLPNGDKLYQNQSHWVRFNNITKEWDTKLITDPVKRPINQPKTLIDAYNLRFL